VKRSRCPRAYCGVACRFFAISTMRRPRFAKWKNKRRRLYSVRIDVIFFSFLSRPLGFPVLGTGSHQSCPRRRIVSSRRACVPLLPHHRTTITLRHTHSYIYIYIYMAIFYSYVQYMYTYRRSDVGYMWRTRGISVGAQRTTSYNIIIIIIIYVYKK
jgi:hypothetical protein